MLPGTQPADAPTWQSLKYSVTTAPGGIGDGAGDGDGDGEGEGDGEGDGVGALPVGSSVPEPPPPQALRATRAHVASRRAGIIVVTEVIALCKPRLGGRMPPWRTSPRRRYPATVGGIVADASPFHVDQTVAEGKRRCLRVKLPRECPLAM